MVAISNAAHRGFQLRAQGVPILITAGRQTVPEDPKATRDVANLAGDAFAPESLRPEGIC
jgi:hypothetical protein